MAESPITPERQEEVLELQTIIDSQEEPSLESALTEIDKPNILSESMESISKNLDKEMGKSIEKTKRVTEPAQLQKGDSLFTARTTRSDESGPMTRQNQYTIMPVVVRQGDEPTCAYVTLSKILVFNLMGIMMDIKMSYVEKINLHRFMQSFVLNTTDKAYDRNLEKYKGISLKGYIIILLFFYFFDWIKEHEMKPFYISPTSRPFEISSPKSSSTDFRIEIPKLYNYLKLTKERLGGTTFYGSDMLLPILVNLRKKADILQWKRTSLCTLNTVKFSTVSKTFDTKQFSELVDIIFPIVKNGIKLTLTLFSETRGLHDVMLAGIEGNHLFISNSWGHAIDVVPIELLPNLSLKHELASDEWKIFQITLLLPIVKNSGVLNELNSQYDNRDFDVLKENLGSYKVPIFSKVNPLDILVLELGESKSGGTRKKRRKKTKCRNKSKRRNKKTVSRV